MEFFPECLSNSINLDAKQKGFYMQILLIGAGRSTGSLVTYLVENAKKYKWKIKIVDQNFDFLDKTIQLLVALSRH